MFYSNKDIKEIRDSYTDVEIIYRQLLLTISDLRAKLTNEDACEHLMHGVGRRLRILTRCVDNIFGIFPIEKTELISNDELLDLDINLHAFFLNISGILDNLAWVLVFEHNLLGNPKEGKIDKHGVGLFKKSTQKHLEPELKSYILSDRMQEWYKEYSKVYRDALTHRIPLYVPPSALSESEQKDYLELEKKLWNFDSIETLLQDDDILEKQSQLGKACPFFAHSFREGCKPVVLHAQVIVDYRTVEEIITIYCKKFY